MERISYKSIIVVLLVGLALLSIAHTIIAKLQFREAAFRAQAVSLARVIEVASDETLRKLHSEAFLLGNTVQSRLVDSRTRQLLAPQQLRVELDDLFLKGFAGTGRIDLARLRVYDIRLELLAQSTEGVQPLSPLAPPMLLARALPRQGAERLKALGGLWQGPDRPLYSLLLPIGGLRLSGYLEVVLDPAYNLGAIPDMTRLPIRITTLDGHEVFTSPGLAEQNDQLLPVEYLIRDDHAQPLYRVTAYEDNHNFYAELHTTQMATTVTFVVVTVAMLLLALYLLSRLLFSPISNLIGNVQHCIEGDLDTTINERGVKEVHLLAHAFNLMARTLRRNMGELQRLSSLDGLTGIANRRAFDQRIEEEWTRALRNRKPLALLILDIDNFKQYNDTLGHQAGDHCLREVAALLEDEMKRPGDLVARYGGEEFAVILAETDAIGAGVVALNLREALRRRAIPHPSSSVDPYITLSIGGNAMIPGTHDSIAQFIHGADRALYEVKRSGRNGITFATGEKQETEGSSATDPLVLPLQ